MLRSSAPILGNARAWHAECDCVESAGFNVEFRLAIKDTAQLAKLLGFDGTAICFSWPSQGSLLDYTVDEANAEWTIRI